GVLGHTTLEPLTPRQQEVIALLAGGLSNREIAERLFISERTAEGHVEQIRLKLELRSRTQIANWAHANGVGPDGAAAPDALRHEQQLAPIGEPAKMASF